MSMNDPLADMLTRIRNATMVKKDSVDMPHSKIKGHIAEILKEEGYINGFHIIEENGPQNTLRIDLKYDDRGRAVITGLKRVSKPGRRVYARHNEIPRVMSGLGVAIVSSSQGVIPDRVARRKRVGGEILCEVW